MRTLERIGLQDDYRPYRVQTSMSCLSFSRVILDITVGKNQGLNGI